VDITFLREGSLVQNFSNLKGQGRLFSGVAVCNSKALWSEVMAGRCTEKDGNR
jgi:hypothetical protein